MNKDKIENIWNEFLRDCSIIEAIEVMVADVKELKINNKRVEKLLRLASCPASPLGEKTNAAKMAFTFISDIVNNKKIEYPYQNI
ncbi:hypothetical protein [Paenibacillus polymyxa]|uniref:hypothetical protein n=1 Tax=Paenibacillus polymyxa TaxID=1406 RepID=UPI002AB4FEC3|nr:hypothetical protein [Paenibacillus polymyxa]MDY8021229.1 hypothetical protein [Paenibacillus polymyxa]